MHLVEGLTLITFIFSPYSSRYYYKVVIVFCAEETRLIMDITGRLYLSIHKSNQIKSNLFAINKVHNKQFIKITYHLAGQTGDSFALMSAHKN